MHRLFLSLIILIVAAGIGCASGSPSPSAATGSVDATGTPVPAPTAAAELPATTVPEGFFLWVSSPEDESVVDRSPVEVQGNTAVDAVLTVNGLVVEVGPQGEFAAPVALEEGPNAIEVIASDFSGNEQALVLSIIYVP